jgi:hypothetical protein
MMSKSTLPQRTLTALVFVALAGCSAQEPAAPAAANPAPVADAPVTPPVDPAPASAAALKQGLALIQPRIVAKTEVYQTIEPRSDGRMFMHPSDTADAVIEIDTTGISSLTLSPFMQDFSAGEACVHNPQAGVVDLIWTLEGSEPQTVRVDRDYDELVKIDTAGAPKLTITVNRGNDVTWCDWASVGFVDVVGAAAPATAAN